MIFQGEYNNTIDPKGRASIPARFRELLAQALGDERLVVTKNWDEGLSAYPLPRWETIVEKVGSSPPGEKKSAAIRLMIAPAVTCSFDKQGRILVPEALRAHAGLQKEIVVVGMLDKIDIYSQPKHAEVTGKAMAFVKEDPQFMADMGF